MTPVEKIKEKLGIVDVVSNYVKLEKAGANLKGKCPFHNEKTPSFFVSPSRNSYYCFGCNAKGDIFSFVQDFEKVDFKGALKILAERAGVTLSDFNPEMAKEKDVLLEILEESTNYFEKHLEGNKKAYDYLTERGLTKETIKEWRIGFALADWNSLGDYLKSKKYKESDVEKAGLIKKGDKGLYDRFRGRIMFPIFDPSGRVVGYSGRIFQSDKEEAKYINSPDTVLFNKSEILYGYHKAKNFIRSKKFALLVEGQMDLIMCHQAGINQAIATSGTALTEGQLDIIKRGSTNLMIAYDGDKAGINASKRAFEIALSLGFDVKVAPLPTGLDPAEIIKKDPEEFKTILRNSLHIIDFTLQNVMKKGLTGRPLIKEIKLNVLPYVNACASPVERAHFISKISEIIKVPEDALYEELSMLPKDDVKEKFEEKTMPAMLTKKESLERKIAGVYFASKDEDLSVMDKVFVRLFGDMPDIVLSVLVEPYRNEKESLIFEAEIGTEDKDREHYFEELLVTLKKEILKTQLDVATSDLKLAEKEGDSERAEQLLKVCRDLTKRLSYLKI